VKILSSEIEILGAQVRLKGDYVIEGRVDGRIETDGCLVIGPDAFVSGEVFAKSVVVHGRADAMIHASERCEFLSTAVVTGGVTAYRFRIEDGASFAGRTMVGLYPLPTARKDSEPVQTSAHAHAAPQRAA
jgi:cytoskeletal protein CcmA (bactofilin family)